MLPLRVCWRCDGWPDVAFTIDGRDWCGACAPWGRAPCPFAGATGLAARVLDRLDCEGLAQVRPEAERIAAWLGRAVEAWPGHAPWRAVRLAERARARLLFLETWRPPPPIPSIWWGGKAWHEASDGAPCPPAPPPSRAGATRP
jgi:hypothetical protein